jgi:putative membrane protein
MRYGRLGLLTFQRIYGSCVKYLLKVIVSAAALGIATWIVPGIQLLTGSAASKAGTLLFVALIFGIINAVLKPVIHLVGCAFYVLTLGLAALVVNGLLLWLTSVIAGDLTLPFHVNGFVAGVEGALLVGIISWVLHLILGEDGKRLPGRRR